MSTSPRAWTPPPRLRMVAYLAASWCLGFAGVNAWHVATGLGEQDRLAAYASGLTIVSLLALVVKVAGAVVAFAAVTDNRPCRDVQEARCP